MSEGLKIYLADPGAIPGIGPERGTRPSGDDTAKYVSRYGSTRYVAYRSGKPVAALQVVSADGKTATVANVYTTPGQRRSGLASELLARARRDFATVRHADDVHLSADGAAWARKNPWGKTDYKFAGTEEILDAIREADPDDAEEEYLPYHEAIVERARRYPSNFHPERHVTWIGTKGYLVRVPVENICFMEGNQWYPAHAAALLRQIESGENHYLEAPAGRIYRVTAKDVKQSEKYEADGELDYQLGMTGPWEKANIGEYWAQLLDGNHRAAAAILAGDAYVDVYIGENYRDTVYKKDRI